jgi:hypothetical protein
MTLSPTRSPVAAAVVAVAAAVVGAAGAVVAVAAVAAVPQHWTPIPFPESPSGKVAMAAMVVMPVMVLLATPAARVAVEVREEEPLKYAPTADWRPRAVSWHAVGLGPWEIAAFRLLPRWKGKREQRATT